MSGPAGARIVPTQLGPFEQVKMSADLLEAHAARDTKESEMADWMVRGCRCAAAARAVLAGAAGSRAGSWWARAGSRAPPCLRRVLGLVAS